LMVVIKVRIFAAALFFLTPVVLAASSATTCFTGAICPQHTMQFIGAPINCAETFGGAQHWKVQEGFEQRCLAYTFVDGSLDLSGRFGENCVWHTCDFGLCGHYGYPESCCTDPDLNLKVICSSSDLSKHVKRSDFNECTQLCMQGLSRGAVTTIVVLAVATSMAAAAAPTNSANASSVQSRNSTSDASGIEKAQTGTCNTQTVADSGKANLDLPAATPEVTHDPNSSPAPCSVGKPQPAGEGVDDPLPSSEAANGLHDSTAVQQCNESPGLETEPDIEVKQYRLVTKGVQGLYKSENNNHFYAVTVTGRTFRDWLGVWWRVATAYSTSLASGYERYNICTRDLGNKRINAIIPLCVFLLPWRGALRFKRDGSLSKAMWMQDDMGALCPVSTNLLAVRLRSHGSPWVLWQRKTSLGDYLLKSLQSVSAIGISAFLAVFGELQMALSLLLVTTIMLIGQRILCSISWLKDWTSKLPDGIQKCWATAPWLALAAHASNVAYLIVFLVNAVIPMHFVIVPGIVLNLLELLVLIRSLHGTNVTLTSPWKETHMPIQVNIGTLQLGLNVGVFALAAMTFTIFLFARLFNEQLFLQAFGSLMIFLGHFSTHVMKNYGSELEELAINTDDPDTVLGEGSTHALLNDLEKSSWPTQGGQFYGCVEHHLAHKHGTTSEQMEALWPILEEKTSIESIVQVAKNPIPSLIVVRKDKETR